MFKGRMKMLPSTKTSQGWMKSMLVAGVVALCFAGATARGAIINVANIAGGADYHNPDHWIGGALPTSSDAAVVNYNRTLNHSIGTHTNDALRLLSASNRADTENAYFNMTGGELSVNYDFSIGYVSGGTGIATLSGGTLAAGTVVNIGHNNADADGSLTISGGTLNWGSQVLNVGTLGSGTLVVEGTGATISGNHVNLSTNATLRFDLGADSVSVLTASGNLTINSAAQLIIDGSNFTGENGTVIDLITFGGSKFGTFSTDNITLQNFTSGLTGEIGYDADSIYLTVIAADLAEPPVITAIEVSSDGGGNLVGVSFEADASSSLWFTPGLTEPVWTNVASGVTPLSHTNTLSTGFYKVTTP
jgi:hypothetical protein